MQNIPIIISEKVLKKVFIEVVDEINKFCIYKYEIIDQYLKNIWIVISNANKYVDEQEPWALKKNNFERMEVVLFTLVETIRQISILLQPFIPDTTEKILDHIKIPHDQRKLESVGFIFNGNFKISLSNPLFPRI